MVILTGLGIFGGKVDATDAHWLATVRSEVNEEVSGLLSSSALSLVAEFDPRKEGWSDARASVFCAYLPLSKYQVLFYPIPDKHAQEWSSLPERYAT